MAEKLSVIIPYVNEYPQNIFTVTNLHEELRDIPHEIIVINNRGTDKAQGYFDEVTKGNPWLKSLVYNDKLSHWSAKNYGISKSEGDILFFCDAHCIVGSGSLVGMYDYYRRNFSSLNGTIHLPLTYSLLEWRKLIYKLVEDRRNGKAHYSFTTFRPSKDVYEVPAMSTCGMMMTRKLYDEVGGWPTELGIYGGGENFINFVLAVLGKKKWIYPQGVLRHFAEKRGYSWNYGDYHRNVMIATYCFGGVDWLLRYARHLGPKLANSDAIVEGIKKTTSHHRQLIKQKQTISIDDWLEGING